MDRNRYSKKLLILGASNLQLPAIIKAKEMGLYVGVVDYNPDAIGLPYADEYFNVSTIDEEGVFQVARDFKADGIMTLATDMPVRSVANACEKLGLIGIPYGTAIKATDKAEMIKAFAANNVEHPWFKIIDNQTNISDIKGCVSYPCICKPTDNSGSRGVLLVCNEAELDNAIQYSANNGRTGRVILEQYLQGKEVSVEIVVYKGIVHVLAVTDKLTTGAPHFVEMGHSQPSQIDEENLLLIKNLAIRAIKALEISYGAAHVEVMLTEKGPVMIELGARLGGDCITTHLVPLSTGIDMVKATIDIALGDVPNLEPIIKSAAVIRYFSSQRGTLLGVEGYKEATKIKNVSEIVILRKIGDKIDEVTNSISRIGYVISVGGSLREAIDACSAVLKMVKFVISPTY